MRNIHDYEIKYQTKSFEDYQVEYRRKKVIEQIEKYHPQRILEIGCGLRPLFVSLSDDVSFVIIEPASDFYNNSVKLNKSAKHKIIKDYFDANFVEKWGDENYDMIICSGLLHEVENPVEMIRNIRKVANKKSIIHINVPNAKSLHRLIAKEAGLISNIYEMSDRNILFQQNSVFDLETLIQLVETNGLEILDKGSYFVKPFTHGQMQMLIDENIIDKNILNGLYGLEKYLPQYGSEIYINCRVKNV